MNLTPAELAVLGTLGGAVAGGFFSTVVSIYNRKSEEKQQFRELVIRASIENWKHVSEISRPGLISPLTDYIVHTAKICELALDGKLGANNVRSELEKINKLMAILEENAIAVARGQRAKPEAKL